MAGLIKGAAYSMPFTLKNNGVILTDSEVDAVRISLNGQVASWPDGTLRYSAEDATWRFPLTQHTSYAINGKTVSYQVEVKIAGEIFPSRIQEIKVEDSIFRREWDET